MSCLTAAGKLSALHSPGGEKVQLSTRMRQGHLGDAAVHPWTLANLFSLRRPCYAGIIFNAHFNPVLGKWHKMHRGHTMKTLIFISPFYKEENRK